MDADEIVIWEMERHRVRVVAHYLTATIIDIRVSQRNGDVDAVCNLFDISLRKVETTSMIVRDGELDRRSGRRSPVRGMKGAKSGDDRARSRLEPSACNPR